MFRFFNSKASTKASKMAPVDDETSSFRSRRRDDDDDDRRKPVWMEKYGPPTRTDFRLIIENLSSRVSWQVNN